MTSRDLFARARNVIPGGVNSPVRAFGAVGGDPLYFASGSGSKMTTRSDRVLLDLCCSWGALLFGHAHEAIVRAVRDAAGKGTSFGASTEQEVVFAEQLCEMVPGMDMVRLVSSGTEAVMTAIRLARGTTGRRKIVKFAGCYHGHSDGVLVSAGSGLMTGGIASSAGVPPEVAADVVVVQYNDTSTVQRICGTMGDDIAAIIVEPIGANMGVVLPEDGFLGGLRDAATSCGAQLILDEVITGFRLGPTTYGAMQNITPDLVCLGKIIGGGLPIGAVGGRREIMEHLAPTGDVYQAGTLSGNPVAVAAGLAMLRLVKTEDPYPRLAALGALVAEGLRQIVDGDGRACVSYVGSMFALFFTDRVPRNHTDVRKCDTTAYGRFFRGMLGAGIYLPPSQFESNFVSTAHTEEDVDTLLTAARSVLKS